MDSKNNGLAPLATMASITPSLNTSPAKSPEFVDGNESNPKQNGFVADEPHNEYEVRFSKEDSILSSKVSIDEEEDDDKTPKLPDGGWGWMVVFSSFIMSMIMDGISFSFGLLYIEFLHEFDASKSTTSWIGSLFLSVPLLTGPVMSALVDRYGCRKMTMLGGVIASIGFIISTQAQSIGLMYLTFGIIAGIGLGMCYVTAVVSIAFWFDKKRNLAVGLGACGTGVGTFVYAPLTQKLIYEFGWRSTTLLLAGTFMNMIVCGALMKEPDWLLEENKKSLKQNKKSSTTVSEKSITEDFPDLEEIRDLMKNGQTSEFLLQKLDMSATSPKDEPKKSHRSVLDLPTFIKQDEKVPLEVLEQLSSNKKLYNVILENYPSILSCRSTSEKGLNKIVEDSLITARVPVTVSMKLKKAKRKPPMIHQQSLPEEPTAHEPLIHTRKFSLRQPAINRSDSLRWYKKQMVNPNHSRLRNIKMHRNSLMYRGAMLNINKYRLRASSCPNIYKNSMTTLAKEHEEKWYEEFLDLFKGMADFSMFSELHFMLMSISTTFLFTWFVVPYFYLAEHLVREEYTESEASLVLSVIGITNTIGMVGLGWAGDQPWLNVTKCYAFCLMVCGLCCIGMLVFTHNYIMLMISSALFGLFFASTFVFTPVLLVELINLDRFTTAYGLTLLCQGFGHLIGPPIAGFLFDITGSWTYSFVQAGIWIIISGIFIILILFTKNRKLWGKGTLEKESSSERESEA